MDAALKARLRVREDSDTQDGNQVRSAEQKPYSRYGQEERQGSTQIQLPSWGHREGLEHRDQESSV